MSDAQCQDCDRYMHYVEEQDLEVIYNQCFGDIPLFCFINRHDDYEDPEVNSRKGSFYSDLNGKITTEAIKTPSDSLLELFSTSDQSGIPINIKEVGIDSFKSFYWRCIL